MIVLGIDPGTTRIGFGVVRVSGNLFTHIESGILDIGDAKTNPERLRKISIALEKLIKKTKPSRVGVEKLFFSKNKKTALSVAEARGVIIETITKHNVPLYEFAPNEIKLAVTGSGNSSKMAVAKMVSLILTMDTRGLLDDATDALAIAIASANTRTL